MRYWQAFFKPMFPLTDTRDVYARVGVRFAWCTGPYLFTAMILCARGNSSMLTSPHAFFIYSIPMLGGTLDWFRLRQSTQTRLKETVAVAE